VHVYGAIRILEGEELIATLKSLVDRYEKKSVNPVSVEKMSPEYLQRELRGIVGFEINITNIDAAYKLSQNRDLKNHTVIVNELEKTDDPASLAIADVMKANPPKH
jgi:transcriptional regulator